MHKDVAIYFDSFRIEYVPLEVLNKIKDKSIAHKYLEYKIMNLLCVDFFCIAFTEYIFAGKSYTNLFSPKEYKKNSNIWSLD